MLLASRKFPVRAFVLLFLLSSIPAFGDGWTFNKGRFPKGKVTVLKLTTGQKSFVDEVGELRGQRRFLDLVRRCHSDNTKTPYVFTLTRQQSIALKNEAGFSPDRFAIFESYRGDRGVDLELNIINRFSEDEFEIPHYLLTRNRVARDWEANTIGWRPNPLAKATPSSIKIGSCP